MPRYWAARMLHRVALHGLRIGYAETYGGLFVDDRDVVVRIGFRRGKGTEPAFVEVSRERAPETIERIIEPSRHRGIANVRPDQQGYRWGGTDSLVLFDGKCNLCNGAVQFLIDHERAPKLKFAPLQSEIASERLTPAMGEDATRALVLGANGDGDPDSIVVIEDGKAYTHSTAALRIAAHLTAPWCSGCSCSTWSRGSFGTWSIDGSRAIAIGGSARPSRAACRRPSCARGSSETRARSCASTSTA